MLKTERKSKAATARAFAADPLGDPPVFPRAAVFE